MLESVWTIKGKSFKPLLKIVSMRPEMRNAYLHNASVEKCVGDSCYDNTLSNIVLILLSSVTTPLNFVYPC
jgi:hypothetical protein